MAKDKNKGKGKDNRDAENTTELEITGEAQESEADSEELTGNLAPVWARGEEVKTKRTLFGKKPKSDNDKNERQARINKLYSHTFDYYPKHNYVSGQEHYHTMDGKERFSRALK